MTRLGVALGANPATFAGLAGLGDLVLTCTGALSRNRALGVEIGSGRSLAEVLDGKQTVAEGVDDHGQYRGAGRARGSGDADRCRACTAFCSRGRPRRRPCSELMARELRAEQDR